MGVDTKAILRKGTTIEQIEKAISAKYTDVKVHAPEKDFMFIIFKDGEDQRQLAVSFTNSCEREDGIAGVWTSLGMWGNSVEIMKYLCETFGGYLDENDCDDQEYYPINFELYSQGSEFTELDEFRHKVIKEVGYDKLKAVMNLLDQYQQIVITKK
jgi:hypothetical protein